MKIIDLKNPELHKAFTVKRSENHCLHRSVVIDIDERVVECSACGAKLDAFDFLVHTTQNEDHWFYHANDFKRKVAELGLIKERLEKDIVNLKSKVKRASA